MSTNFNPRSREGSDGAVSVQDYFQRISIHAPVKGATWRAPIPRYRLQYFNPRSREGSDHQWRAARSLPRHFNPRSREGSDINCDICRLSKSLISIHAPVKGATGSSNRTHNQRYISIHAPVKGATVRISADYIVCIISIHAPVKGAT